MTLSWGGGGPWASIRSWVQILSSHAKSQVWLHANLACNPSTGGRRRDRLGLAGYKVQIHNPKRTLNSWSSLTSRIVQTTFGYMKACLLTPQRLPCYSCQAWLLHTTNIKGKGTMVLSGTSQEAIPGILSIPFHLWLKMVVLELTVSESLGTHTFPISGQTHLDSWCLCVKQGQYQIYRVVVKNNWNTPFKAWRVVKGALL